MAIIDDTFNLAELDGSNGFRLDGLDTSDFSGFSVSAAGDVNGDGFDDFIIGAPYADPNGSSSGAGYVVFGKAGGYASTFDLSSLDGSNGFSLNGLASADFTGYSVSGAGDVNNDGFDDLIIGADGAASKLSDSGSSYVVFGKAAGFTASFDLSSLDGSNGYRLDGIADGDSSGSSVSGAGDVNGDGFDDFIIGAHAGGSKLSDSGQSYVVFGKAGGYSADFNLGSLDGSNGFRLDGVAAFDFAGYSVSGAGDVNGDGFDDVLVGANFADNTGNASGSTYVVFGKATGFDAAINLSTLDGSNGFRLDGASSPDRSGYSVSDAGDINGDGFDDVVVGAYNTGYNGSQSGSAFVYFGKANGFSASFDLGDLDGTNGFRLDGMAAGDQTGIAVSSAGDFNGDGFDDLLVGAIAADPNGADSGSTYVVFGKAGGFPAAIDLGSLNGSAGFRLDGVAAGDQSGISVSSAGDINNDGFDDLIVGAQTTDINGSNSGSSYVIFGSDAVINTRPIGAVTISGTVREDETLTASNTLTDPDGLGAISYQWHADGVPIEAASSGTYLLGQGDVGKLITVTASYTDGRGIEESATSDSTAAVQNLNDDPQGDVFISGQAIQGETLTATNTLTDLDGLGTISYQWRADGVVIDGATTGLLVLTQNEVGKEITVSATYTDEQGTDESVPSTATAQVQNINDAPTGQIRITGIAAVGETLSFTNTLADADGLGTFSYQWTENGVPIEGATSNSFTLTQDQFGLFVNVIASFTDGFGNDESVSSANPPTRVANVNTVVRLSSLDGSNGFRLVGEAAFDYSSLFVAAAGDFNGDGFGDVIVGAPGADPNGINDAGAGYLIFGKPGGFAASLNLAELDGSNGFRLNGVSISDQTGYAVNGAGDVNGDGFDDLIVAAYVADHSGASSGSTYVVFGTDSPFSAEFDLSSLDGGNGFRLDGEAMNDRFGRAVSSAGDINGDGFDDLLIGAVQADHNGENSGSSYVVFGKASGFAATFAIANLDGSDGFRLDGEAADDFTGLSVNTLGDINDDGFDDFIVGAFLTDVAGNDSGSSYVVFGKASGFQATLDLAALDGSDGFRVNGVAAEDRLGQSVSGAGDINGDGIADFIIGAPLAGPVQGGDGSSYVVFGKTGAYSAVLDLTDLDGSNGFRVDGVWGGDLAGTAVSGVGDFNGDGFDDLLIGAITADPNGSQSGSSYLVFGKAGGFTATFNLADLDQRSGLRFDGVATLDYSGSSVSAAGDINADGFDDLIIGAASADPNGIDSGASYVVFGRSIDLLVEGSPGDDFLFGGNGDDTVRGFDGRDTLEGLAGNDLLEGGAAIDLALFHNDLADYSILNDDGEITVEGPGNGFDNEGTDTLIGVERLQFDDMNLAFDLDGNAGTITKLLGVVLGADDWYHREFIGIGLDIVDNNVISLDTLMDLAFSVILGDNPTNAAVVNLIYTNLVGQAPSQQEQDSLVADLLDSGAFTQGSLGVLALDHELNTTNIGLVGLIQSGVEYLAIG